MIEIKKKNCSEPYNIFFNYLDKALKTKQPSVDAISISSFNRDLNEVDSRFVNLKYIIDDEWIFFSNYNSKKSKDFSTHDQISILVYWNEINVQIRIKAKINKSSPSLSDIHFTGRTKEKNALALSSGQSEAIDSYEAVQRNYKATLNNNKKLFKRPDFWGGYSFTPYYFEFWEGHNSRLNRRSVYENSKGCWNLSLLQP
tara:strand:+ start:123 stop:722 length:600 start_codon:yes stop_codon:yes gene_type:complete